MDAFLLFLVVLVGAIQCFFLYWILIALDAMKDFSKEDAQVKATTEQVKQAGKRLPKQKE